MTYWYPFQNPMFFTPSALSFMVNYLKWSQKVNGNNSFSTWEDYIVGVPESTNIGFLLLNTFINGTNYFKKKLF